MNYSEKDIIRGKKKLNNNLIAGFVMNENKQEIWRIIKKGGNKKGGNKKVHLKKNIVSSFNLWWGNKVVKNQKGGDTNTNIDLKTAVRLLKEYYYEN